MAKKHHDVNQLRDGFKHVSIRLHYEGIETEVFLDIELPDHLVDAFPKALIALINKEARKYA